MKITKQELTDLNACEAGLERFIQQTNDTDEPVDVASLVGGLNTCRDAVWLAYKKLPPTRIVRLDCDCALINIELIQPYTDKYDLIVDFLKNPNRFSRSDALAARNAAYYTFYPRHIADYNATAYPAYPAYAAYSAAAYAAYNAYSTANNAVTYAAKISPDAVNKLLIDMFNEVE